MRIVFYNERNTQLTLMWGYSSVGRAPALHAGGQEFESLYLHHTWTLKITYNSKEETRERSSY